MIFTVDWSLSSESVSIDTVCKITGVTAEYVKEMYSSGYLGPVPATAMHLGVSLPLFHLGSLLVLREANKNEIPNSRILEVLPAIAGAVYVQFQLAEFEAGRCVQRGGTPKLNFQLWTMLRSSGGRAIFEERLPDGPVRTHRYACFNGSSSFACDDLNELEGPHEAWKTLDAWEIASQMKRGLPGTFFATHIG